MMMWRFWILLGACLALCGCTYPPRGAPQVELREVKIPVSVPCAGKKPDRPPFADSETAIAAAPDIFELAKLKVAGQKQRDAYIAELEASRAGCD